MTATLGASVRRQCGTEWGYRLHKIHSEPYCYDCRAACAAAARQRRRASGIPARQPTACGIQSGYTRHVTTGTEPWKACRAAQAAYMRDYRARCGRQSISTRIWIRHVLETWDRGWFTTNELTF